MNQKKSFKKAALCVLSAIFCLSCMFIVTGCEFSLFSASSSVETSGGGSTLKKNNEPYVTEVKITSMPEKTEYLAGEKFSPKGLKFNAVWVLDGENETIDMTYADCESYTHKGEALTADIEKIVFTIGGYDFEVNITVTDRNFVKLNLQGDVLNTDWFVGTQLDLTQIQVTAENGAGETETIALENCVLSEAGEEVSNPATYVLEKGKHEFKFSFAGLEANFTVTGWEESDLSSLSVKSISLDQRALKSAYAIGENIDLSVLAVNAVYTDATGDVNLSATVADGWTAQDGGTAVSDLNQYLLTTAGDHEITITYCGASAGFTLKVNSYDTITIAKRDGSDSTALIGQGANFARNYAVTISVSGTSLSRLLTAGEYTLSESANGDSVAYDSIFATAGSKTVYVRFADIKQSFNFTVDATTYTLTLDGATYNSGSTVQLTYGSSIPETVTPASGNTVYGWYNGTDTSEYWLDDEFIMPQSNDLTVKPITEFVTTACNSREAGSKTYVYYNSDKTQAGEMDVSSENGYSNNKVLYTIYATEANTIVEGNNGNHVTNNAESGQLVKMTFTLVGSGSISFRYRIDYWGEQKIYDASTVSVALDSEQGIDTVTVYFYLPANVLTHGSQSVAAGKDCTFQILLDETLSESVSFTIECAVATLP
jgi:hypothetical protein